MQHQAPPFDFIDIAAKAYGFVWDKRKTLIYLAIWPVALKFLSLLIIYYFGLQNAFLRQGLILLPAYFAEGWLAAQAIRLMIISEENLLGHPGPKLRLVQRSFEQNRRELLAAVILYVLVIVISTAAVGSILDINMTPEQLESGQPPANSLAPVFGLMAMAVAIWAFRFIWLYVVVALGYRIKEYVERVPSIMMSFLMLGSWLICIVPLGLVIMIISQLTLEVLGQSPEDPGTLYSIVSLALSSVYEGILAIITTAAMSAAIVQIMEEQTPRGKR